MQQIAASDAAPKLADSMSNGLVPLFGAIGAGILVMMIAVLVVTLWIQPRVPRFG